ncbi:MAG TPA: cytochrome c [Polyangiaceae bacterium]|nr:cytochrome c [Polyangiaceae bacterium]
MNVMFEPLQTGRARSSSSYRKLIVCCCVCLSCGCSRSESPAPAGSATPPPPQTAQPTATPATTATQAPVAGNAEAQKLFKARCGVCHGAAGKGDGPGAAALNPKPRNYTNAEWQKSISDEAIAKIIVTGGAAVGKSPSMPANPDLASKPAVVSGLVGIVRSFAN